MLNVLDVVTLVNIVLDGDEYIMEGDINQDGVLNVLDIVTLVNMISGKHYIDLSDYDNFDSIKTKNYYLPGKYTVYVTIEDNVLQLEYERYIGRLGKV